jgi:hypothetical protein
VEEFLDSFFPILILIAVAVFRILSMVNRRKRKPVRKTNRGFQPWANNNPPASPPSPVVVRTEQAPSREEEFSAWNLSVDEEAPPEPAPVSPLPEPRPAEIRMAVFPAMLPPETPAPAAAVPDYAPEIAEAGDDSIPGEAFPDTPAPVVSRTRSLPPLQQGIIWAEILGTPKGL